MQAQVHLPALRIEGELTIYHAAAWKPRLLASLEDDGAAPVALDLSAVTEIDCAGVQLLLLASRAAQARGRRLLLAERSPCVSDTLAMLNLAPYFDDA